MRHLYFNSIALFIFTCFMLIGVGMPSYAQSNFSPTEYVVRKIYIDGNTKFKTRWLKKLMNLKDKQFLRTKTFTRRLIELDRILLESIYIRNGYLDCAVRDSFKIFENGEVDLYYHITEGKQYFLKEITIHGEKSLSKEKIISLLDHKIDEPYNPIQIRNGIKAIINEYANIGKPLALVTDSLEIKSDIHLTISIDENPTMCIGEIQIVNNQKVKDKPIRREVVLKPGSVYSKQQLELSKKHIFETGLFSSVHIRLSDIDTTKHTLSLVVEVRELDMRYLGGKIGFGQERGITEGSGEYTSFSLDGEWLHRNIAGRGSRLSINLGLSVNITDILTKWSQNRPATSTSITYIEPWLFGFRSSTSFRLFFENGFLNKKKFTKYGEETALIYRPDKRFLASTGIVIQKVIWTDTTGAQKDTTAEEFERAFTFTVRRDYRDNFLYPSKGTLIMFDGKIVGTILGGTQDYYMFETSFSQYYPLFRRVVFAYRGNFGYLGKFPGKGDPPDYSKLYLGGPSSLRGWYYNKFNEDGGNVKVLTNAEIRFPLFWKIGGEIFVDGGDLVPDIKKLFSRKYRWNAGIGLTIATPIGPIRVDCAKKLNPISQYEVENLWQIQFGIPYSF